MDKTVPEMILEVLTKKRATVFEISDLIGFQENSIRTAIFRLKEIGMIKETGYFKRKYKVYEIPNIPYDTINPLLDLSLNTIDTEILTKMILPFVKRNITLKLTKNESERITKLFVESYNDAGERVNGK